MKTRSIKQVLKSQPVIEGAGVNLKRAFGFGEAPLFDPFLLLDDFRSGNPDDYLKGFPWHPHRGIETITYILRGSVEHQDSIGNKGVIGCGDIQWMTAGSGILHQEMPQPDSEGFNEGFQLWANLRSDEKMIAPSYYEVTSGMIPIAEPEKGIVIKVISGKIGGTIGPVKQGTVEAVYLDITLEAGIEYELSTDPEHNAFTYVIDGSAAFDHGKTELYDNRNVILFNQGDKVSISAGHQGVRFLMITGKPLNEPIAWRGPIVMNTDAELKTAFEEFRSGKFIK